MSNASSSGNPLDFLKDMWGNMGFNLPGMVTPTLDVDELDKRISDMKTVESWLKMNLNMLSMTIQGLEVQRATLAAVKAMSETATKGGSSSAGNEPPANPFLNPALWPWNMMGQAAPAPQPSAGQPAAKAAPAADTQPAATTGTASGKRGG